MNEDRHEELARKLSAIEVPPPPEGLLDKLRDDIPSEFPVENRSRVTQFTGWSLGLAASLIVMIGAAWFAVQYQKSPAFETAAPVAATPKFADEGITSVAPPASAMAEPAKPQPVAQSAKLRTAATASEAKDERRKQVAANEDAPVEAPPAPAIAQPSFAPEELPSDVAEAQQMPEAEDRVGNRVVGGVAGRLERDAAKDETAAAAPQRADAKSAASGATLQKKNAPAPGAPPRETREAMSVAPLRVGGDIPVPRVLRKVRPVVSAELKRLDFSGIAVLDVVIDERGNVARTTVVKGLPFGLNEAVVAAVRQWKFAPTVVNGRAVPVVLLVPVDVRAE